MDTAKFNSEIRLLVESWCDRRELDALSKLLPAWLGNFWHTDQAEHLAEQLRHVSGFCRQLPDNERERLKRLWVELDTVLRNR